MSTDLDLDGDLAYVDGAGSVTVRLKRPNGPFEVPVEFAVMGDLARALRSFGGIDLTGGETAWELPDALPAGEALGPDDEIVAAGVTYVVDQAVKLPLDAGWRAIARPKRGGAG